MVFFVRCLITLSPFFVLSDYQDPYGWDSGHGDDYYPQPPKRVRGKEGSVSYHMFYTQQGLFYLRVITFPCDLLEALPTQVQLGPKK